MLNVKVQTDFKSFEKAIKHIPTDIERQFAIGLSRIAKAGRDEARTAFKTNYIQRTPYMTQGIVSFGATKNKLEARVGTINYLMALHLFGGEKSGNVAVKGIRGDNKRGRVTKSTSVDYLSKQAVSRTKGGSNKSHKFFEKTVNGHKYIMAKTGGTKPRERKRAGYGGQVYLSTPIVPMWLLREGKAIKVKADWGLETVVGMVMVNKGPGILTAIIEDAWNHAVEKGRV